MASPDKQVCFDDVAIPRAEGCIATLGVRVSRACRSRRRSTPLSLCHYESYRATTQQCAAIHLRTFVYLHERGWSGLRQIVPASWLASAHAWPCPVQSCASPRAVAMQ